MFNVPTYGGGERGEETAGRKSIHKPQRVTEKLRRLSALGASKRSVLLLLEMMCHCLGLWGGLINFDSLFTLLPWSSIIDGSANVTQTQSIFKCCNSEQNTEAIQNIPQTHGQTKTISSHFRLREIFITCSGACSGCFMRQLWSDGRYWNSMSMNKKQARIIRGVSNVS